MALSYPFLPAHRPADRAVWPGRVIQVLILCGSFRFSFQLSASCECERPDCMMPELRVVLIACEGGVQSLQKSSNDVFASS